MSLRNPPSTTRNQIESEFVQTPAYPGESVSVTDGVNVLSYREDSVGPGGGSGSYPNVVDPTQRYSNSTAAARSVGCSTWRTFSPEPSYPWTHRRAWHSRCRGLLVRARVNEYAGRDDCPSLFQSPARNCFLQSCSGATQRSFKNTVPRITTAQKKSSLGHYVRKRAVSEERFAGKSDAEKLHLSRRVLLFRYRNVATQNDPSTTEKIPRPHACGAGM